MEKEHEGFNTSLELEGFILDLDSEEEFHGLEILDVSRKTPLSGEELERIEDAELKFEPGGLRGITSQSRLFLQSTAPGT